jgi:hypothetical protein
MTNRSRISIIPIGSLHTGWALKVDGVLRRSSPSLISLGAYVDAIIAGADEANADNIARAIEARPWPTYEERMAVFSPAGPWMPSRPVPDCRLWSTTKRLMAAGRSTTPFCTSNARLVSLARQNSARG